MFAIDECLFISLSREVELIQNIKCSRCTRARIYIHICIVENFNNEFIAQTVIYI